MLLATSTLASALIAAGALGVACAVLSVFVVAKRWAFIGEGIAHAGFGGAGTAWMLTLLLPTWTFLARDEVVYGISILFCGLVALAVAGLTRKRRAAVDTVVGIFLVASLAWGFLAYGLYSKQTGHMPPQFADYLGFERLRALPGTFVAMAVVVCVAVLTTVWLTWKELLFYGTDERQAEASGVNVPVVHYGLILLLTLVIIVGMRLMGTVLVVALLVLPGATAMQLAKTTRGAVKASIVTGLVATLAGPLISSRRPEIPEGPAIVLVLFGLFLLALASARFRRAA